MRDHQLLYILKDRGTLLVLRQADKIPSAPLHG